jgi:hypothetical protein
MRSFNSLLHRGEGRLAHKVGSDEWALFRFDEHQAGAVIV